MLLRGIGCVTVSEAGSTVYRDRLLSVTVVDANSIGFEDLPVSDFVSVSEGSTELLNHSLSDLVSSTDGRKL